MTQRPPSLPEHQADPDAQQHHDQRGGDDRLLQRLRLGPRATSSAIDEQADHGRAGLDVAEQSAEFGERVLVVRLLERHVPFRVGVVAQDVGNLLQDQDHADRGQQALDHAGREEGREEPGPGDAQRDLDQPGDDHGQQERLERAERGDLGRDDRRQAGGRAADAGVRPAQHPDQDAADDPGQHPREQRGVGRQRHAQAQAAGRRGTRPGRP